MSAANLSSPPALLIDADISNPVARLDRLRPTSRHFLWIGILGLGYLVETFDNTVFGYLAPAIRAQWGLSIASVGVITSAVFYGMMAGGLIGGRLLDRFGRKPVLIWSSVFYSVTSVFCAVAPNFQALFVGRVLTGFAVQAATGAILVFVSEMYPRLSRGRFFAAVIFFGYVGAPVTSFTAAAIAPSGPSAWRWVFGLGLIGVVIAVAVAAGLPETVRWLSMHGRRPAAVTIVENLETLDRRRGELAPVQPVPEPPATGSFRELFKRVYARRLLVVTVTFGAMLFCQYGFAAYLATILVGSGMTQAHALHTASIITLGTLAAAPILFFGADRVERKTAILLEAAVTAAGLVVFGHAQNSTTVIIAGMAVYAGLAALVTSFYNFITEIFPTEVRGVGTGIVNGIGRIAGIISSLAVASMYVRFGVSRLYLILGCIVMAAGAVVFVLGPRTTQRSLETISPE